MSQIARALRLRTTDSANQIAVKSHIAHAVDEVGGAVAVTHFVVVPGQDLDHVAAHDHRPFGDEDGAVGLTDDVGEDDRVFFVREDALHLFGFGRGLNGGVDFLNGDVFGDFDDEVDDGAGRGRDAEGDTGQFAVDGGDNKPDRFRGAGRRRDDIDGSGAAAIDVLIGLVERDLVVREGVDRGHEAFDDAEAVVEDLGDRREAVGRAGRVGDVFLIGGQFFVVDAENAREDVVALSGSGDDDLVDVVAVVTFFVAGRGSGEETGRFEDDLSAEFTPRNTRGFGFLADGDLFAVDDEVVFIVFDFAVEATLRGVVLQKEREGFRVGEVVDADDVILFRGFRHLTEDDTTDTTETINTNFNSSHSKSP